MEVKTMQVTELPAEGLKRQFKIVVPAGDLSAKVDERLAEMARTAQMPGFRAGKVPVGLLKKQYGQALGHQSSGDSGQDVARARRRQGRRRMDVDDGPSIRRRDHRVGSLEQDGGAASSRRLACPVDLA